MKKGFILLFTFFVGIWFISASAGNLHNVKNQDSSVKSKAVQSMSTVRPDLNFGKIPLYFITNKGQVNEKALYYAKASRYTLWLTKEGLVFEAHSAECRAQGKKKKTALNNNRPAHSPKTVRDVSRLLFLDANRNPQVVPIEETELKVNYFKGNDKSKWRCDIPTSQAVLYKNLYKNIDLKVYGIEKAIEYDWIVKPGGNHQNIRFEYKNVKGTRLDEEGNLLIETGFGELMHKRPVSCQWIGMGHGAWSVERKEGRRNVDVQFKKIGKNIYGFEVGEYDKSRELIIDPVVLAYSTYLGGGGWEWGYGIAVDGSGCAYVTGYTASSFFPTLNQYQANQGDDDVFITKLDTTKSGASSLIYSTYLGGSGSDRGCGIAVDSGGCAYVTGSTSSSNFPTLDQYQANQGDSDAFIAKIDTTKSGASSLIYSTYLGGSASDSGSDIAVEGSRYAYVAGNTNSPDFPTMNQYQSHQGYQDVFITKIDTTKSGGSGLIYSTYLGSAYGDWGYGIAVDGSGSAYVTGMAAGSDFPTLNEYQSFQGGWDAFFSKIDTTKSGASSLIYSTCLGAAGSLDDWGQGVAVDTGGYAYVTGYTNGAGFPTRNQYQSHQGDYDAFITKIDPAKNGNSSLIFSTYLGGEDEDRGYGIAVDGSGCVFVTGYTYSSDFPTLNKYQAYGGNRDAFITKLDTTKSGASSLVYSTYVGGEGSDYGRGAAVDAGGCAYLTGNTGSLSFPIVNEYQANLANSYDNDAFITKLVLCTETPSLQLNRTSLYFGAVSGGPQTGSQTFSVSVIGGCSLNWTASSGETWLNVTPANGSGSGLATVSIDTAGLAAGTYTGTVSITCASASNSPQTVSVTLNIYNVGGAGSSGVPFGQYATPVDNAAVSSSVPFTGWALDDVGIDSVKLYRRDNGSLAYIGDAVFVEGARADVEQAYADYPLSYRAGWGYMMLTHFLPNGGNGTFTIEAIAADLEGHQISLGAKTVVVDNANAVNPFGAIDTPAQGGTASGSDYRNNGWVLTPLPNTVPTDGTTINVYIDGVLRGNPVYNVYRPDIASFFPGYNNSDGAHAYLNFDTTPYENGVHTIYWTAEDDAGNIDGIGSRYFSIQNSGSSARVSNVQRLLADTEPGKLPVNYSSPVTVKKGCGRNIKPQKVYPDDNGIITIETGELERVVIHLDGGITSSRDSLRPVSPVPSTDSGIYQNTGGRLRPLPIGSTFDAERNIFYWQPGPGFIGQYNFVFIKKGPKDRWQKKIIRVVIRCK
jgi:hypothetical protein